MISIFYIFETCFMAQFYGLFWWKWHIHFKIIYIVIEKSISKYHLDVLVDSTVQLFYILMILYLLFADRGVLKLPIMIGLTYMFFLFFQFFQCIFWGSLIGCIHIKHYFIFFMKWPIYYYGKFFFIPGNIFFWNVCCLVLI